MARCGVDVSGTTWTSTAYADPTQRALEQHHREPTQSDRCAIERKWRLRGALASQAAVTSYHDGASDSVHIPTTARRSYRMEARSLGMLTPYWTGPPGVELRFAIYVWASRFKVLQI